MVTPVVYVGPHTAAQVAGGTVCPRNTPVDVDDGLAGRLLARPDFTPPEDPAGEVTGDGSGEALPPVDPAAYPPDATPLDDQEE